MITYPRNMIGYGAKNPNFKWPNNERLALQIVLNYEEGAENNILHGDKESESFLSEIIGAKSVNNSRNMNMESIYEYGSRRGFWRIYDLFTKKMKLPITIFGVAMALQRNNEVCSAIKESNFELACHGWKWIDYQNVDLETEKEHIKLAVKTIENLFGDKPLGWYTGRCSPNTRNLIVDEGNFLYDSDSYSDDLPYWEKVKGKNHLVIPYTLDNNDMRFASYQGFNSGDQFFNYLKDSFDTLYEEGEYNPKMMSIGLHCRLIGRPGRFQSLIKFLNYVLQHDKVWICRRVDIAKHWIKNYAID